MDSSHTVSKAGFDVFFDVSLHEQTVDLCDLRRHDDHVMSLWTTVWISIARKTVMGHIFCWIEIRLLKRCSDKNGFLYFGVLMQIACSLRLVVSLSIRDAKAQFLCIIVKNLGHVAFRFVHVHLKATADVLGFIWTPVLHHTARYWRLYFINRNELVVSLAMWSGCQSDSLRWPSSSQGINLSFSVSATWWLKINRIILPKMDMLIGNHCSTCHVLAFSS